ncbi:MAG: nuclear transport factor 2 family protein [Pseudomonadota bacterium]
MTARIDLFRAVIETWRDTQDVDAVLSKMTDDVVWHYSAATKAPKIGKDGAREFLDSFKENVRNPRWRIFEYAENGDTLFVEGVDEFDTPDGKTVVIPYAGVIEFRGDLICGWRDYFDRKIADAGARGEALPDYAAALADRQAVA